MALVLAFHLNDYAGDPMGLASMTLTMRIVESGTLELGEYAHGLIELAYVDGTFYSGMPPGQSVLAVPLYAVTRPALVAASRWLHPVFKRMPTNGPRRFDEPFMVRRVLLLMIFQLLVVVPVAASVPVMIYDLSGQMLASGRARLLLALLLGMGTLWWAYGAGAGHRVLPAAAALAICWWPLCRRPFLSDRRALAEAGLLGLAAALSMAIRYDSALVFVPVLIWLALRSSRREVLAAAAMLTLGFGLTGWYHAACFGSPTELPYSSKLTPPVRVSADAPVEHLRFDGIDWVIARHNRVGMRLSNISQGLYAAPLGLWRFSPALLLVVLAPAVIAQGTGRGRPVALVALAAVLCGLFTLYVMPHPGFRGSVGPRYLLPSLPFWVLLLAPVWEMLGERLQAALVGISVLPSYLAAAFTSRLDAAWSLEPLRQFGLSTYTLSRLQEGSEAITGVHSTVVCLIFWAVIIVIGRRMLQGSEGQRSAEGVTRRTRDVRQMAR